MTADPIAPTAPLDRPGPLEPAELRAAAGRLSPHLVATPSIGEVRLPGFVVSQHLVIKAENLQPSGSLWYRGALHTLLRALGAWKGVAFAGDARWLLAMARAACQVRVPARAVSSAPRDAALHGELRELGAEVICADDAAAVQATLERLRTRDGLHVARGLDDRDCFVGVATLGLELARDLPADIDGVVVSPARFAAPLDAGLRAAGRELPVRGVAPAAHDAARLDRLRCALTAGLRIDSDRDGVAALATALDTPDAALCAVLAC